MTKAIYSKPFKHLRIAAILQNQMAKGVLQVGDRLPSLRTICARHGVSQSTALAVYHYLETKALIEARPRSGYFVCASPQKLLSLPGASRPQEYAFDGSIDALVARVYANQGNKNTGVSFALGVPDNALLPVAKLNKCLVKAMRSMQGNGVAMEPPQGNEKLRRLVARWSFGMGAKLDPDNIITTAGCLNAISFCLMALTQPGDRIAMESPVSFGMLQVAQNLGLVIEELPCHPLTGIDVNALEKAFAKRKIRICLLISNFSNPLGSCMPDEHKKQVVALLEKYGVPLIENDLNGDIYFGTSRPASCKTYDESGMVLWCGSVSKTLAPGYRVGWVEAGRFKNKLLQAKIYHAISATSVTHEAVAGFLETGRYETHLRKLRQTLYSNHLHYLRAINAFFPAEKIKLSRPQGGFVLWLELDKKIDTVALYEEAAARNIGIAPGKMFTLKNQYNNCMRLNYGLFWDDKKLQALKTLGHLVKKML